MLENKIKEDLLSFLRNFFVDEIYKDYDNEENDYENLPQRCLYATFGSNDFFIKRRARWYENLGGCVNDFFPILLVPPKYSHFRRPLRLIHFKRMQLIFKYFFRWLYEKKIEINPIYETLKWDAEHGSLPRFKMDELNQTKEKFEKY